MIKTFLLAKELCPFLYSLLPLVAVQMFNDTLSEISYFLVDKRLQKSIKTYSTRGKLKPEFVLSNRFVYDQITHRSQRNSKLRISKNRSSKNHANDQHDLAISAI